MSVREKSDKSKKRPPTIYGPKATYIKLISYDSQHFYLRRDIAEQSQTIKTMVSSALKCKETDPMEIRFLEIDAKTLHCICRYLMYKYSYNTSNLVTAQFDVPDDLAVQLVMAANFLEI
uniref:Elongin-C n=1 Tax=Rhabditophanes sp. KR3021 TaxID=114890 RepID=A0AC35U689_9BILA